ncbi:MAG: thermonuclease family protein [Ignavibacterium album]|uniref:thermonuclease family protein n=1 Tax=Ignavibacterium album TaxID=591197 RepID=UPI0026ED8D24|nr:thermonuclease family protein [Ignavibacterium album]MBI5662345.1 thermonuclease family protein [Ignavibacterium album]
MYNILISIVILILFSGFALAQNPNFSYPYNYTRKAFVSRVIDGDTFVLSDSQHVRMLGIDTPELGITGKPSESFSDSAYYFTKSLIVGKFIKLTFACPSEAERRRDGKAFDVFGRLLAYTWLTDVNGKDSLFIQAELLKKGYARISYYNKDKKYYHFFYNLRRTAMQKKLGIWSVRGE